MASVLHSESPSGDRDGQAISLWTFVHLRNPGFTPRDAADLVGRLHLDPGASPKDLAEHLGAELRDHGIAMKHVHLLEAASRLLGHTSWHAANRAKPWAKLRLTRLDGGGEETFADWSSIAPQLKELCSGKGELLRVQCGARFMLIASIERGSRPKHGGIPLVMVHPSQDDPKWLDGSPAAIEGLRRHLEENGNAVLDGTAVLQLCEPRYPSPVPHPNMTTPADAANSELVLLREDSDLHTGYEIARGDEVVCWSQLELACKEEEADIIMTAEVDEEDGSWRVGRGRYVWQLSTLRPDDFIPGLMIRQLAVWDTKPLLHRYRRARAIFGTVIGRHADLKQLEYLGSLSEEYRVDRHRLLLELKRQGLSWEDYCTEIGESQPLTDRLPVGFVFSLVERLKLDDPNVVFARPNRSEMRRADNDELLRSLLPRIHHVTYRVARELPVEVKQQVKELVDDFSSSLGVQQMMQAGVISQADPLPYLCFANDAEEMRQGAENLGLELFVATIPRLFKAPELAQVPNAWPFAIGTSLYLSFEPPA
jgi:hypothetical protein